LPLELLLLAQIYAPNRLSAGALPQTHWGSLHRSPRPPSWFTGGAHGEWEGGRGGEKEGGEGREGRGGRPGMPKSRVGKPTCHQTAPSCRLAQQTTCSMLFGRVQTRHLVLSVGQGCLSGLHCACRGLMCICRSNADP